MKDEEITRYYFEKRQDIYDRIDIIFNKYIEFFAEADFEKGKIELSNDYKMIIGKLQMYFPQEYVEKFCNLYQKAIQNLCDESINKKNYKDSRERIDTYISSLVKINGLEETAITVDGIKDPYVIEDISDGIMVFKEKLKDYIILKSGSTNK